MLWESVDAAEALAARFGFSSPETAATWIKGALGREWGIAVSSCARLVISDQNLLAWVRVSDQDLILKCSVFTLAFERLAQTARLTSWLHAQGLPVAPPVPAKDGRLQLEAEGFSLGLQPVMAGELLDSSDPVQVEQAGRLLAAFHEALGAYPDRVDDFPWRDPASRGPGSTGRRQGTQLVHNDFRSANILHHGTRINAVLDLEEVAYATRMQDLAKAAVFLGTRYRQWSPTPPEVRAHFVAAYEQEFPLSTADRQELDGSVGAHLSQMGWQ
jgi:homoserine kinase type II